ncbi:MAG: hypothetical protein U1E27_13290, partial [Kiritimatiellia bacterium]|nr:hypothetical protein [Kiritimatiellia bacterium]
FILVSWEMQKVILNELFVLSALINVIVIAWHNALLRIMGKARYYCIVSMLVIAGGGIYVANVTASWLMTLPSGGGRRGDTPIEQRYDPTP